METTTSALTSGRPRRPTRACTPRETEIGEERRPKDEGNPPDRLRHLFSNFLLYGIGDDFIVQGARLTRNCPEGNCFADFADTASSAGGQCMNHYGARSTETNWYERVSRSTHEVARTGELKYTTGRDHAIAQNVELEMNVRTNPPEAFRLAEARVGKCTALANTVKKALRFNAESPRHQDHISVVIYLIMSELGGGVTVVNGWTMIDCDNRPEGNGVFLRATKAERSTRDSALTELTMRGNPRGRHQRGEEEDLSLLDIATAEKDQADGDSNMKTTVILGLVQVIMLSAAMEMKKAEVSQASTGYIVASPVAVEAPRHSRTESSSSSSWPRRAGGLAAKDVADAVSMRKGEMKNAPPSEPAPVPMPRWTVGRRRIPQGSRPRLDGITAALVCRRRLESLPSHRWEDVLAPHSSGIIPDAQALMTKWNALSSIMA
jgi:hypothetical protein